SKPDPHNDVSELPLDAEEAHAKLVEHYADQALEGIADKIPAGDVPAARAALVAFFAINPRATQLIEQLVAGRAAEGGGTTAKRDVAALAAAASGRKGK